MVEFFSFVSAYKLIKNTSDGWSIYILSNVTPLLSKLRNYKFFGRLVQCKSYYIKLNNKYFRLRFGLAMQLILI